MKYSLSHIRKLRAALHKIAPSYTAYMFEEIPSYRDNYYKEYLESLDLLNQFLNEIEDKVLENNEKWDH